MPNLYFDFIVPIRKRTKRARSASNPWIRWNGAPSSSTASASSEKALCGRQEISDGSKEFRECSHCKATETPLWREGPMGPNTLCNACGVRYRTGQLFPEYRPANSPTFVPTLHSNSHRKVVEMRRKGVEEASAAMVEEDSVMRAAAADAEEKKKMEEGKK
ncbi:PREDICTED: GATA transcription factor 11-like [Ipomoea nil]|uniref:GATA transcription factor 11-like n=1 Tax=Ipomoea nil TaxID=35883 RepID=UPI000901AA53|nr:PREDICTED: GATA transcription factor 11-like [Ipomoea nil]